MHSSLRQHALTQQKISKAFARSFFFFFFSFFVLLCPLRQVQVALPDMGKAYQPREQRYTFLSVCSILCVQQWYGCQCLGFLTCAQILMRAIAHRGCTRADTARKSVLEVDSRRKNLSLAARGDSVEPPSVLRPLAFRSFQSDALKMATGVYKEREPLDK